MVASPRAGDAGNGRYAAQLANSLAATAHPGDDAWALVAEPGALARLDLRVRHAGLSPNNARRLLASAPRVLSGIRADIAVFTYVGPFVGRTPVALAVHDATFVTNPEWLPARARVMLQRLVPLSARRADRVLALSRTAAAEIEDALGVPGDRIRVVSPAVDPRFRPDGGAAAARVADALGVSGRFCLAVGDVNPRKNLSALARAVARLDDLNLVLAGSPGATSDPVLRDPRVRWLGRVGDDDLADLYRAAAVTAFPSLHEGFGLPAVEAMASGCPLVVSNRGALPEVVGDAAIVTGTSTDEIAEALRAALEPTAADRLRELGPRRAAAYTVEAMGEAGWAALGRPA